MATIQRPIQKGSVSSRGSVLPPTRSSAVPRPRASASEVFKKIHETNKDALRTLYNR